MTFSIILKKHGSVNQEEEVRHPLTLTFSIMTVLGVGRKKPQFDHTLWNIYDRVIADLPRSNNSVEGWHSAFANHVTITHPTIKKLTEKIRGEQPRSFNTATVNASVNSRIRYTYGRIRPVNRPFGIDRITGRKSPCRIRQYTVTVPVKYATFYGRVSAYTAGHDNVYGRTSP